MSVKRPSLSSSSFGDRLFKLLVLLGTPLMGYIYFAQHSDKSVGRTQTIVPFRVEKAPSLEGLKTTGAALPSWSSGSLNVVNFWATWCPPCVEEMPAMAELASRLRKLGVNFYFVSVDEKWTDVENFLESNIIDLPAESLFWDPNKETAFRWKSEKFPETFVIDSEGWMIEKIVGFQDWTRPSVVSYFEDLAKRKRGGGISMNNFKKSLGSRGPSFLALVGAMLLPIADAQEKSGAVPLIHEDDKKSLGKLQQNVETANKNVSKIEAAIKDEERSFREINVKIEREERDRKEIAEQLSKVKETLSEVDRVRKKNEDSLAMEKSEKDRVQKDAENLQIKLKELEKELNRTRDEVILTNQKISTRLQNIESFNKALTSSQEELKSLKDREKKLASSLKKEEDVISEMQRDASRRESKLKSFERDLSKWNETLEKEKQRLIEFEKLLK